MSEEKKQKERKRIDAYICQDLHTTITKVIDEGSVPPMVTCPTCHQPARSMGFHVNQNFSHTVEWYKPTQAEMDAQSLKMKKDEFDRFKEYVTKGALISRLAEPTKKDGE